MKSRTIHLDGVKNHMMLSRKVVAFAFSALFLVAFSVPMRAEVSKAAEDALSKDLLGKDVKPLLDMPAYKEGIDIYYVPPKGKRSDDRGIDLQGLTKWLKAKGVGVEKGEDVVITNVKVDSDKVEIHLGGGGEGRRGSNHANKVGAGFKRAGGSRINFRYQAPVTDLDLQPVMFLKFMSRLLDVSELQGALDAQQMPAEYKDAIQSHSVIKGMSYEMVLLSFGSPEQKKIEDSTDSSFHETWYYLKDGHRWVLHFVNGKMDQVQTF